MSDRKNIFPEEIELSEIVLDKTNHAFEMIKQEGTGYMKKQNIGNKGSYKKMAAAIAGICLFTVSSISVAAAIHHYWGRGMSGNIQASETEQQELTESGVATVYRGNPDYASLAVTDQGITIAPDTVIVDERFVYMSFHISGYSVTDGEEPGFEFVNVYQGDDPEAYRSWVNMSGRMYDGVVSDENGTPVYEDGSPLMLDENGKVISYYTDENGDMEFILQAYVTDENDTLLGKTMHVEFENLGTLAKADFFPVVDGKWDFEMTLSDVSSSEDIAVGQKVEGTDFVLESISISPISIQANYSFSGTPERNEDGDLGVPAIKGIVLKDGTRIPYLTDGGVVVLDAANSTAYHMAGYDRVVDVDDIAALLVLTAPGSEAVEISIAK